MTLKRKQYQEKLKTQPLWLALHNNSDLRTLAPSRITKITKRYVYTECGEHSGSMAIYESELEAWEAIVNKLKSKVTQRDYINDLYNRLTELEDKKPHLFV